MSRPKENKAHVHARVNETTKRELEDIACNLGMTHGERGRTGKLLDLIAENRDLIEPILKKYLTV